MNYGFVRTAAAVPKVRIADCEYNARRIMGLMEKANEKGVQFVVFPELCITSYTCGDLFQQETLLQDAIENLEQILKKTSGTGTVSILGMPLHYRNKLFNCGVAIQDGRILGAVPKSYVPGYNEFYEGRWFAPASEEYTGVLRLCGQDVPFGNDLIFRDAKDQKICFGIELCEDLWVAIPRSSWQALAGATLLFNLSASNDLITKLDYRKTLVRHQSAKCIAAYTYASCGMGESTTDLVFGGHAIVAENGVILSESERFSDKDQIVYTDTDVERLVNDRIKNTSFKHTGGPNFREVLFETDCSDSIDIERDFSPYPFVPSDETRRDERCREVFMIQTSGLAARLNHTGIGKTVVGVSGGLDSTLALLVTAKTFDRMKRDRKNIIAVTMPGFGTTGHTYENAIKLAESLGTVKMDIDIREACIKHFKDIGHDPQEHDVTYENVQARERTQILMDIANREGGLVAGTSDLSEMALGWSTYNGDHMSMYAVNCGVPKTLVRYLVEWIAENVADNSTRQVLRSVLNTPITPELLPPDDEGGIGQRTEDIIGPYELHDFFLYHIVRYGADPKKTAFLAKKAFGKRYDDGEIKKWLKLFIQRFFSQQFKRSCVPDGPKVGTISLSPRGDWRMPSDATCAAWLKRLENQI